MYDFENQKSIDSVNFIESLNSVDESVASYMSTS